MGKIGFVVFFEESHATVVAPPMTINAGKYHNALYESPAQPEAMTTALESQSVIALLLRSTAATVIMPTVAALSPVKNA